MRRGGAARKLVQGQRSLERLADGPVESDLLAGRANGDLGRAVAPFGPDVELAAARKRVDADGREIEQNLDRRLGQLRLGHGPLQHDATIVAHEPLHQVARLLGRDRIAETTGRTIGQPEELQLVGADPRALLEQFHAPMAHLGIALVAQQFDAVAQGAHRAEHIVTQAGTEKGSKIDGI